MRMQMIEHSRLRGVNRFVPDGTVCDYPEFTPEPFKEDDLWHADPEEMNLLNDLSSMMMPVRLHACRQQCRFYGCVSSACESPRAVRQL
jgi:GDP-L-fucose synthase